MEETQKAYPVQPQSPQSTEVKLAVLEDRLNRTQSDVAKLELALDRHMEKINKSLDDLKNRPNSVTQFIEENWKAIVLVVLTILGANATLIENLGKLLSQ